MNSAKTGRFPTPPGPQPHASAVFKADASACSGRWLRASRLQIFTLCLCLVLSLSGGTALAKELRILAWQGYADDDWIKEFALATGADVNVVVIGNDDEVWSNINRGGGADFDVFAVNTAQLQRYIDAGLATPFDLTHVPNQKAQLPLFRDLTKVKGVMRDGKVYGIPFCFDAMGIIYDVTKVAKPPTSIKALWDPAYSGRVLAHDGGEHNASLSALALGYPDPFHLDTTQMEAVKGRLKALKDNVLSFFTTADEALQIYLSNDVALVWANYGQQQVKSLQEAGAPIAFIIPEEGGLVWLDTWAMTRSVQDKELAEQWVNFVLQKRIGVALSERTGFGNTVAPSPNARAGDKLIYLEPAEDPAMREAIWNAIKSAP